jgi:hypothetical protein
MADVYSNAALIIAASRSPNCNDGFFPDRNMAPWVPVCFEDTDGSLELMIMASRESWAACGPWPFTSETTYSRYLSETTS